MQKKLPFIIGGIVLIVLSTVAALFLFNKTAQAPEQIDVTSESQETTESSTMGSIKSLMGKNVTCTITYPDGSGSGTVYVAGEKMRGDFVMTAGGKETDGHMISDGEYMYSWSSAASQGTKIKINATAAQGDSQKSNDVDLDREVEMDCDNWSVDESKFELPTGIDFMEISAGIGQTNNQGQSPALGTDVCEQITDIEARLACTKSLGN